MHAHPETVTPQTYVRTMSTDERIAHLQAENASLRRTLQAVAALAQAGATDDAAGDLASTTRPEVTSSAENSPSADHAA